MNEDELKTHHKSSKHKKKSKKHKKHVSSSSSESECEMEWVEASVSAHKSVTQLKALKDVSEDSISNKNNTSEKRDEWMNEESFARTLSRNEMCSNSSKERKKLALKEQREKDQAIHEARELNPYLKKSSKSLEDESGSEKLQLPSTSVGDGGYSWLKKAYLRIQEQAQEQCRSMEEVAVERWGSLDKLVTMIEEAESRMNTNLKSKYRRSQGEQIHNEFKKSKRHDQFKKPFDEEKYPPYDSERSSFKFRKPHESKHKKNLCFSSKSRKEYKNTEIDKSYSKNHEFKEKELISTVDKPIDRYETIGHDLKKGRIESDLDRHLGANYSKMESINPEKMTRVPAWKKQKPDAKHTSSSFSSQTTEMSKRDLENTSIEYESSSNYKSKSSSSTESQSKNDEKPLFYTKDDISKLASKVIKAELVGNMDLAEKLKKELDEARKFVVEKPSMKSNQKQEVILMKSDITGQVQPLRITSDDEIPFQKSKKNKYFDDGSKYSLKQMFEREKLTTADDNLEMFMEVASECKQTTDIDYEMDDVAKKVSQKMSHIRQEEKDVGKAIKQHQKRQAALEKCIYCLDQPNMKHHLIADIGEQAYLCLPSYQSLVEGHCLIVPKVHTVSFLCLDENEWAEIEDYKRKLRKLFKLEKKSVIFLETSMNFRHCPHAVIECIPVPFSDADMAPMYFKKAILESEAEWAHNIKLVDLSKKGLRNSVPKNLPYFFVEFDPEIHAGFAHVIEEEKYFPKNFGKEVVGGMLDIDYNYLYKNKKEDPLKKSNEVFKFGNNWKKIKNENS